PVGRAFGGSDGARAARRAIAALHVPGLRLAGLPRRAQYGGEPDGLPLWARLLHRGSDCGRDVPLAPHAARASAPWYPTRRAGPAGTGAVAAFRSAGEAALSGVPRRWRSDDMNDQIHPELHEIPIGIRATGTRRETDSMGEIEVPADRYWGAQTQRSLVHFSIGDDRMPKRVYHAYGYVKKAAAVVNARAGRLS